MASAKLNRRGGLFAMLGSLLWTVGWILTAFAGGGTGAERRWRTLLVNPAMLLFMAGLAGFHARQAVRSGQLGKTGFAVCLLGTGTMLLGNVVEFWVSEYFYGTQRPGWVMMGVGLIMLPAGFVLLGIGTLRARVFTGWRRAVPLGFGLMLALLVIVTVAQPPNEGVLGAILVVIALGWTALGYALWSEKAESSDTPT